MKNAEFDIPWRINWRLSGSEPEKTVLRRVREANPLAVVLELAHLEILERLSLPWPRTTVVVVAENWAATPPPWPPVPVARWELPVSGPGELDRAVAHLAGSVPPERLSARWIPGRGQLKLLPAIIDACLAAGWGLTLPNRPAGAITALGREGYPQPKELTPRLTSGLAARAALFPEGRLKVHDFILALAMDVPGPEPSGCEAANSIAYVDDRGTVFPCGSLLVPLGSLMEQTMSVIWAGRERQAVREAIAALPEECRSCRHVGSCSGGCRGAVFHLEGRYDVPDPLCPGG